MAILLSDSIRVGQQKPIDDKYYNGLSPYSSISDVNTNILSSVRYRGLTVNINGIEYWYKDGILDSNLVVKSVDLSGYVPYTGASSNVNLGSNSLTTNNIILPKLSSDPTAITDATIIYSKVGAAGYDVPFYIGQDGKAIQIGNQIVIAFVNNSGGTLNAGTPICLNSSSIVVAARADTPQYPALGIVLDDVTNGASGRYTVNGTVKGIDLSAFTNGDKIYLGTTGGLVNTLPPSGTVTQFIGVIGDNSNGGSSSLLVLMGTPSPSSVTSVGLSMPSAFSVANSPITGSGTLIVTLNSGYIIPTTSNYNNTNWDTAYTNRITSLTTTGSSGSATLVSNTLNIPTYTLAGLGGISLTALSATTPLSYNNTTGVFSIQIASTSQSGYLSSTDWTTFNNKQAALGYTPVTDARTLTINGTTFDLTANRSWTIATVTSLASLTDVTLTSLTNNQLLQYSSGSTKWINITPSASLVGLGSVVNSLQVINAGNVVSFASGILSSRPTAGTLGRFYYATDNGNEYYDNGSTWQLKFGPLSGDVSSSNNSTVVTVNRILNTSISTLAKGYLYYDGISALIWNQPITSATSGQLLVSNGTNSGTSYSGLTWDNVNGVFNITATTSELRLTTLSDSNYSRILRSTTSNSLYVKSYANQIGGLGAALQLSGSSANITANDTGLPSGTNPPFTISLWINSQGATGSNNVVFTYGNGLIRLYFAPSYTYGYNINGSTGQIFHGTAVGWVNIVVTFDGTTATLYENNSSKATSTPSSFTQTISGTSSGLTIGTGNSFGSPYLNQILIYNRALTIGEIYSLYNSGIGSAPNSIPTSGLVRKYNLNEGSGNILNDTNPNITQYNATVTNNSGSWTATGKVPSSSVLVESTIIQFQDGFYAGEKGTLYIGDTSTGNIIQGLNTRFLINNTNVPLIIGSNYKTYINSSNTSQTTQSLSDLGVVGGVSIGTFVTTTVAPTNGLAVSGISLFGTSTSNGSTLAQFATNPTPSTTATYSLGNSTYLWNSVYANSHILGVLANPTGTPTSATATTGGTLAAGTYYYKIVAVDALGGLTLPGTEKSQVTTGTTSTVTLTWTAVPGASSYQIWRGTATNSENVYATSSTNSYTDTGTMTSGTISSSNTTQLGYVSNTGAFLGSGNVSIGAYSTASLFSVGQSTTGIGTMTLASTTITGTGTQFTNTFKIGDTFTLSSVLYTISAIGSDTSMTVSPSGTVSTPTAYTLTGGNRLNVYGNGNVVFGSTSNMWYDARYGALNIGTSTQQSSYLLNVNGAAAVTTLNGLTLSQSGGNTNLYLGNINGGNGGAAGTYNMSIGYNGMRVTNSSSQYNIGIGNNNFYQLSSGVYNISISNSYGAYNITTGSYNTFVNSGPINNCSYATLIGYNVNNSTPTNAVGIGANCGVGVNGISIGYGIGSNSGSVPGTNNILMGCATTGTNIGSASYSILIGTTDNSHITNTFGNNNILIGHNIGAYSLSGSYNTIIGSNLGISNVSNNLILGDSQGNEKIRVFSSGNLSLGFGNNPADDGVNKLQVNGSAKATAFNSNATQTTVSASTSGTVVFSEPMAGSSMRMIMIYCNAALGTASYTFPTAFTNTPIVLSSNGLATSLVTSISTIAVTVTGANNSGILVLIGY